MAEMICLKHNCPKGKTSKPEREMGFVSNLTARTCRAVLFCSTSTTSVFDFHQFAAFGFGLGYDFFLL
jgi:hypothetical protein